MVLLVLSLALIVYASSVTSQTIKHTPSLQSVIQPYPSPVVLISSNNVTNQTSAVAVQTSAVVPTTPTPVNKTSAAMPVTSTHIQPTLPPTLPPVKSCQEFSNSLKEKSSTCIKIVAAVMLNVKYKTKANKTLDARAFCLPNGTVTGTCKGKGKPTNTSTITISWGSYYSLTMTFEFAKDLAWKTKSIDVKINTVKNINFPDAKESEITAKLQPGVNKGISSAAGNHSYYCGTNKQLSLTNDVTIQFEKIKIQPYTLNVNGTFAQASKCTTETKPEKSNSIVPIAVGCALAGLIIIVLIAYLIGRRKSHRGYQQV